MRSLVCRQSIQRGAAIYGDNLYTASIVAIDVETGEIKWHYQTTPHDGRDYDGVNEFVNFDMEKDGEQWVAVVSGWGGDIAAIVKDFDQGGSV